MHHTFGSEPIKQPYTDEEIAEFNDNSFGLSHELGINVSYMSPERTEGYVDVVPAHHQYTGVAHGGLYCTIGETLASIAAVAVAGKPALGISNNTDLLGGVSEGRIDAAALPVHLGRMTHLWRVEMYHEAKLVATTNLKLMIMGDK